MAAAQSDKPASASSPDSTVRLQIARQPLSNALMAFAKQTGVQLMYHAEDVRRDVISPAVTGPYTTDRALTKILDSSGLSFYHVNSNTIAIRVAAGIPNPVPAPPSDNGSSVAAAGPGGTQMRLASAGDDTSSASKTDATSPEEVIVSAEKRNERLQDVPVPVTAISTDSLADNNQTELRDFYTKIPGLNLTDAGIYGGSVISFRGITSGILNGGTTTTVIDDVPYGISSNPGGPTSVVPEIDPADLVRVEALRGPQGTLYGASSMGGLLKYVTIDPSTDAANGYVRVGGSGVHNGDGLGYSVSAGGNLPLSETWAARASAYTRRDPGYIDDPVHSLDGINWAEVTGGRIAALWRPNPQASIKFGALFQDSKSGGNTYAGPTVGYGTLQDLQQVSAPGAGGYHKTLQVYSVNAALRLGTIDLNSISAYTINKAEYEFDTSSVYGAITRKNFGVSGSEAVSIGTTRRFTQEIRFTVPIGEQAEWLFGGFYVDEDNPRTNHYLALDFNTGQAVGQIGFLQFPSTFEEKAAFTDLTYHFTDQFDVQVGGRAAYNTQTLPQADSGGPLFGGPHTQPELVSKDHSFTYLLTPRFKLSTDVMLYARLASGYRPGGPNLNTAADPAIPLTFAPDKTQNYEIGAKGVVLDHILTFDASVYYINWQHIQLSSLLSPRSLNYKDNGGNAKSQGVDLSLELRPWKGLKVSAWGSWDLAELTENFPVNSSIRGFDGAPLPFTSRFSGSLSVDQEFPLVGSLDGFVGISESYVGDRRGPFVGGTGLRGDLPEYFNTDLHGGVRAGAWEVNLFVNNLCDRRGLLMGGPGSFLPNIYSYTRPRTVGVNLSVKF